MLHKSEMFKKNFQDEGFFGKKWQEVQRRIPGTKTYNAVKNRHPKDTERGILTGRSGNLGRSVTSRTEKGEAIVFTDGGHSTKGCCSGYGGHFRAVQSFKYLGMN